MYLQWFGNTSVSIFGFPNAPTCSKANIQTTKPVSLTLCSSGSLGHPTVSVIDTDISGDSYTWTPNGSLSNGDYSLELWQENGDFAFSHDVTVVDGRINNDASTSSEVSTSITAFASSIEAPATVLTVSSLRISTADPTSSSSILASGHSFSLATMTAIATLPATATIPALVSQSPDVQDVPVLQRANSSGAIAGIVVGVVAFILLTTKSAILCWRRRHRSSQIAASELPSHQMDAESKSDLSATVWIPELGREGAVCGPRELAGTCRSLGSLGGNEPCLAQGRVFEIANPE